MNNKNTIFLKKKLQKPCEKQSLQVPFSILRIVNIGIEQLTRANWISTKWYNKEGFNQTLHANNAELNTERDVQT